MAKHSFNSYLKTTHSFTSFVQGISQAVTTILRIRLRLRISSIVMTMATKFSSTTRIPRIVTRATNSLIKMFIGQTATLNIRKISIQSVLGMRWDFQGTNLSVKKPTLPSALYTRWRWQNITTRVPKFAMSASPISATVNYLWTWDGRLLNQIDAESLLELDYT